jgi:hypothetical protein
MPPTPRLPRGRSLRQIPWDVVLSTAMQIAQQGKRRWDRLTQREQRDLVESVRRSRGRLRNLTQRERTELRRIVWKALGPER